MIRQNLPEDLKTYFGELDNPAYDFSKCEVMERINYLLFTLTLYKLPDMYKVRATDSPVYVYSLTIGKKARKTVNATDILGGVFKYNDLTKHVTANYPIAFINAICCVLFRRWNAFILTTNNKGMFDDGDTAENFALSLKNIAYNNIQVVRFIKTLPTTDVNNIYAIGVSLGALTMIDVYAIEDSYKKVVVILGGTPIDEIIFSSSEGMVKNFYNRMAELYGSYKEANRKITEVVAPFDKVVQYADGSGMSIITVTSGDTSIPSNTQKQLIFICKPVDIVAINYNKTLAKIKKLANGHYQALIWYPYLVCRSIKFLSKKEV